MRYYRKLELDQNKISIGLISLGSVLIVAALTLMALVFTGVIGGSTTGNSDLNTTTTFGEPIKSATPGPTPKESVTLITCGGTFSSATHQYDKRLVVRAERIEEAPALPPPA